MEGIKLVIGPGCLSNFKAIAPIAEKHGAALFSTGLLDNEIFRKHSNIISLATEISIEAKHMAHYMKERKVKSVAILSAADAFGEEFKSLIPYPL